MASNLKLMGLVAIVIFALGVFYLIRTENIDETNYTPIKTNTSVVAKGSTVEIDHSVSENGAILRNYTGVRFTVGSGDIMPGIDEAVIGMKLNEEKNVTLMPADSYGDYDYNLVQVVPRVQRSERVQTSQVKEFTEEFGEEPIVNKTYLAKKLGWQITVLKVYENSVTFRHDPYDNTTLSTAFGEARVNVTRSDVYIILPDVSVNSIVSTISGLAIIKEKNDSDFILDFNHELAGRTLMFSIRVTSMEHNTTVNVNSTNTVTLKYFWSQYCPYCKKEEPILQEFLKEHPKLNFIRIDVDNKESAAEIEKYDITGTPGFVLIKGDEVKIHVGYLNKKQVNDFLCSKLQDEKCLKSVS